MMFGFVDIVVVLLFGLTCELVFINLSFVFGLEIGVGLFVC